jgi:hypothetical protein
MSNLKKEKKRKRKEKGLLLVSKAKDIEDVRAS